MDSRDEALRQPIRTEIPPARLRESGITPAARTYLELEGGQGREVRFRPPRYQQADFGPVGAIVDVLWEGKQVACALYDVSQTGVAFEWDERPQLIIGSILAEITVRFDEHEAYRGCARIGSVRRVDEKVIVGVSFVDTLMNIDDVLQLRDVKAWAVGTGDRSLGLPDAAWRVDRHHTFKSLVAELRLFLEDAEEHFRALERSLPWHVLHGEHESPAREALIERIRTEFAGEFVRMSENIDEAMRLAAPKERQGLKEFSIRQVQALLMLSPCLYRARHKPLGYPGDYEVMNSIYGNPFAGSTLFAKAVNLACVSTRVAAAVRARKTLVKDRLRARLAEDPPRQRPWRFLSVAAGPAQEIYELLSEMDRTSHPIEVYLFDQDKGALAFSHTRLKRLSSTFAEGALKVVHLHDSIKRLLRDPDIFSHHGEFDAIFSAGLFDYLQLPTAVSLSRNLYANLAPGGTLYVGNMVPSNPSRWIMEFHLDWQLIYREPSEILDFARMAAPSAPIELLEEPTGINPFVALRKT